MSDFFKSRTFIIAMVLTVCFGIFAAVSSSGQKNTFLTRVAGVVVSPVQNAFSAIGEGFSSVTGYFENIKNIRDENEQLKQQLEDTQREMLEFEKYKEENERLKDLLNLKTKVQNKFDLEAAKVIAKETRNFSTVFVLNKGSLAGIEVSNAVITDEGLVGYVCEVGPNYSKVATLFEVDVAVGAICIRTSDSGVIEGELEFQIDGYCKMSYISKDATLVVGDYVETSGYGGIYPPGIMIGRIEEISLESHGISQYAKILPSADLKGPKEVMVIKSFSTVEEGK